MKWPDARGWIGLGVFSLVVVILGLEAAIPELRHDEFFKTIGTLIIGTAFVNGVVSWAYSATKSGGELADRNADIVAAAAATTDTPQPVVVTNEPDNAVPISDAATPPAG